MAELTPGAWAGIALLAAYAVWLWAFFTHVRPRAMRSLGRRLRVRVVESTDVVDAGTWSIEHADAPIAKTGIVLAVDFAILLLGTVGVAALVFIPAFLFAESGTMLPLEGRITGRSVALRVMAPATMVSGRSTIRVETVNDGRQSLRMCRALVDGYAARNGYLNGTSPWFDLDVSARRVVDVALDATRPPLGEHAFRLKVECANQRLAVGDAMLNVR